MNQSSKTLSITLVLFPLIISGCMIGGNGPDESVEILHTSTIEPTSTEVTLPTPTNILEVLNTPRPRAIDLPARAIDFDEYIQESIEVNHIPGLAYSLVLPGGQIYGQAYGLRDIEGNLPVTPNTLFHIGSMQKSMNSMLVAALVDAGYFGWDTPVIEIFPDFKLSSSAYSQLVTMRHLLSMSSGIPDYAEDDIDVQTATSADILQVVASTKLLFSPGGVFSYSNLSATMAGYIAGYAYSGGDDDLYQGYVGALDALVLRPIGMTSSTFSVTEARSRNDFSYSYVLPNGRDAQLAESYDIDKDPLAPSGILKANVLELGAYIATQINGGLAPNGKRIVSSENLSQTWQAVLEGYALGWDNLQYKSTQLIFHTGSYDNYVSVFAFLPDYHIGLVILINSEDAGYLLTEDAPYELIDILKENGL